MDSENIVKEELLEEELEVEGETKEEKFKRLGAARVNRILNYLDQLGKLSGKSYEYTPEMVDSMFAAIEKKTAETKSKFSTAKGNSFSF